MMYIHLKSMNYTKMNRQYGKDVLSDVQYVQYGVWCHEFKDGWERSRMNNTWFDSEHPQHTKSD